MADYMVRKAVASGILVLLKKSPEVRKKLKGIGTGYNFLIFRLRNFLADATRKGS